MLGDFFLCPVTDCELFNYIFYALDIYLLQHTILCGDSVFLLPGKIFVAVPHSFLDIAYPLLNFLSN